MRIYKYIKNGASFFRLLFPMIRHPSPPVGGGNPVILHFVYKRSPRRTSREGFWRGVTLA